MYVPQAALPSSTNAGQPTIIAVSRDTTTDAGEPIRYLSTPNPEVTSMILSLAPGGKTDWMTHPVPGYIYVLEGELTVEFVDGSHLKFKAGQAFLQANTKWHRGLNEGKGTMRFLAVFFGEQGKPVILNPPHGAIVDQR
jgi:quercetin dioxygenase-like cupin family protein